MNTITITLNAADLKIIRELLWNEKSDLWHDLAATTDDQERDHIDRRLRITNEAWKKIPDLDEARHNIARYTRQENHWATATDDEVLAYANQNMHWGGYVWWHKTTEAPEATS